MRISQKITQIFVLSLIFSFMLTPSVGAVYSEASNINESAVNSITVAGEGSEIKWDVDGYSSKGFKVVWSKNENPTYPLRNGDKYHYYSSPDKKTDELTAFNGAGTYYIRVCEYLGGKCGVYSNQIKLTLGKSDESPEDNTKDSIDSSSESNVCCKIFGYGSEMEIVNVQYILKNVDDCSTPSNFVGGGKLIVDDSYCNEQESVDSIKVYNENSKIIWEVDGYSKNGFKVVWSKNEQPTYPTREGDKYIYHSDPSTRSSRITAFNGSGDYYVRVCEYIGGACEVYSNEIAVSLVAEEKEAVACTMEYNPVCGKNGKTYSNKCMAVDAAGVEIEYYGECKVDEDIVKIEKKANYLYEDKLDAILEELNELRDLVKEQQAQIKYLTELKDDVVALSSKVESMINNFITYGVDENTEKLGAGERAAVMYSYKDAYGKLPESEEEMTDAIKIANGRWPSERSEEAEGKAIENFMHIYGREADMDNPNDNAAVTIMAYGLRQKAQNRNLESEKNGIKIFESIFGHTPSNTEEWNIMQAITYSGASK